MPWPLPPDSLRGHPTLPHVRHIQLFFAQSQLVHFSFSEGAALPAAYFSFAVWTRLELQCSHGWLAPYAAVLAACASSVGVLACIIAFAESEAAIWNSGPSSKFTPHSPQ